MVGLAGDAATSYTYHADGQRTQAAHGMTTTMTASYNGAQELTAYSASAAHMTAASYDGLRATATSTPSGGSSTTQSSVWDETGGLPQLLLDSTNPYIYGPRTPLEQVTLSDGATHYLNSDVLGSTSGIVSSTGTLTNTTSYDAWGNPQTTGGLNTTTPFEPDRVRASDFLCRRG